MSDNNLTISDLTGVKQTPQYAEVDASAIRPATSEDATNSKPDPIFGDVFGKLDAAIDRKKNELDERRDEIANELHEAKLEVESGEEIDGDYSDTPVLSGPVTTAATEKKVSVFVAQEDIDLDDEDLDETDDETKLKVIKESIKEKIKPITNVVDLKSFTISKKPVSVLNALKSSTDKHIIDWVLPAGKKVISMEAFSGFDIEKMNPQASGRNRFNTYTDIYNRIYNHIVDPNKAPTMESWVKTVKFFDINHLYFAIYKATFDGSNSVPYQCPKCKEVFMKDMTIDAMIKYKDDESKAKIQAMFGGDSTTVANEYEVELVQVSDNYVVGLREPSIYNVIFENVVLDEQFTEKYSDILSILSYVDNIYLIDREGGQLLPIELKEYPNNAVKTIKTKVQKYSQILEALSSDQFYQFNSYIKAINDRHDLLSYILPECECEKCKHVIPEQTMTAESLLFTRHQLAGIANT